LFEGGDEGVLRELFGETDVTYHAGESRDEARGFDAPHGVDGAVGLGVHCSDESTGIGSGARR